MKKRIFRSFFTALMLFATIGVIFAASANGVYGGSNGKSINYSWHTGWNIQGDFTQATASNRSGSPAYMKRVYARSGDEGSYSEWVYSGTTSVTRKDLGPYKTDKYDARFYWDYDQ